MKAPCVRETGPVDVAIVLGSGLSDLFGRREAFLRVPYAELGHPLAELEGHAGHALIGALHGKRVLFFAGRVHGYQGFNAREITHNVAIAAAAGAKSLIVTNAAGALNAEYEPGDLMVIRDHINLSGMNPLVGMELPQSFVNMNEAYSPRLRAIGRKLDPAAHEGVYAGVLGPSFETPAEAHFLRTIGADAVGMSTVAETIAARAAGLEVFGVSLITNRVAAPDLSHLEVAEVARRNGGRLASMIDGVVAAI